MLRYFADLAVAEAASCMDCAQGTVRALTAQAVARLESEFLSTEETVPDGR